MPSVKPTLPLLKTPMSSTFPSELPRSPLPGGLHEVVKQEGSIKTPITPPTAYIDFLKALSSPTAESPITSDRSCKASPRSNPSSQSSACSCTCEHRQSPKFTIPPSPVTKLQSAPPTGALRRLRIPQSPLYSPNTNSPLSARSMRSPFSFRSPHEWDFDSSFRAFDAPQSKTMRPVSVRQVVTRTVTYTPRMDLAPAPKGKKRRIE